MAGNILESLNKIDAAAAGILSQVEEGKKKIDQEMADKTNAYDAAAAEDTRKKIEAIRAEYDQKTNEMLLQTKKEADERILSLKDNYDKNHKAIVHALFQKIINEL